MPSLNHDFDELLSSLDNSLTSKFPDSESDWALIEDSLHMSIGSDRDTESVLLDDKEQ